MLNKINLRNVILFIIIIFRFKNSLLIQVTMHKNVIETTLTKVFLDNPNIRKIKKKIRL